MTNKPNTTADLKKHFEENLLDGDAIQGGQMLSSEEVFEYICDLIEVCATAAARELKDFERADYERLKQMEIEGIQQYREMRKAGALTPDYVVSFINQLSPWNLETSGKEILKAYLDLELKATLDRVEAATKEAYKTANDGDDIVQAYQAAIAAERKRLEGTHE